MALEYRVFYYNNRFFLLGARNILIVPTEYTKATADSYIKLSWVLLPEGLDAELTFVLFVSKEQYYNFNHPAKLS